MLTKRVRAVRGALVYDNSINGYVPGDRFVTVELSAHIGRAIKFGDLEEEKNPTAPAPAPAPAPVLATKHDQVVGYLRANYSGSERPSVRSVAKALRVSWATAREGFSSVWPDK